MTPDLPKGFRRIAFDSVGSTNDEARRFASAGAGDGLIVTAGEQRTGRGRLGRNWASPVGNLYASFVTRPDVPLRRAAEIAFVAALAAHDAVRAAAPGEDIRCKWPNDLLAGGRKICGILAEATGRSDGGVDFVIVGFGINVAFHPAESRWPATSLAQLGAPASADGVLMALAADFARWRSVWDNDGFDSIRQAWLDRSFTIGKPLTLNTGKAEIAGTFAGIDTTGSLLLDLADGRRETVAYGEVTSVEAG